MHIIDQNFCRAQLQFIMTLINFFCRPHCQFKMISVTLLSLLFSPQITLILAAARNINSLTGLGSFYPAFLGYITVLNCPE